MPRRTPGVPSNVKREPLEIFPIGVRQLLTIRSVLTYRRTADNGSTSCARSLCRSPIDNRHSTGKIERSWAKRDPSVDNRRSTEFQPSTGNFELSAEQGRYIKYANCYVNCNARKTIHCRNSSFPVTLFKFRVRRLIRLKIACYLEPPPIRN